MPLFTATRYAILCSAVSAILVSCGLSQDEKKKLEQENVAEFATYDEQKDPLFAQYDDSLRMYFGQLEIDLIKQYKKNHENLKTEEDFYYFYRNANTLKQALTLKLRNHAVEFRKQGKSELHAISWFRTLAQGLDVEIIHKGLTYGVFFDYKDFHDHAIKTQGTIDDEFIKLLEMSYEDHAFLPKWVRPVSEYKGCSVLGEGKHLAIFKQIELAGKTGELFKREIQGVKTEMMSDMLFKKEYCSTLELVCAEITNILSTVKLDDNERKLLTSRIDKLKSATDIKFSCSTPDCVQ